MASKKNSVSASDSKKNLYSCDECEQTLSSLAKLKYHKKAHKKPSSMTCNICKKVFSYAGNLARHQRIHTGDQAYKCPICNRAFNQGSHRSRHVRLVHKVENIGSSLNCETGNKKCNKKQKKGKWKMPMGNGCYECDVCGKNFKKANSLRVHKRSHPTPSATATPFLCDLCGKAFKRAGTLAAHKKQHARKKLAFCDICKKGYSTAQALVVHTRTHTGEKPYACDLCGSTFRQQGHLQQHMHTVHSKAKKYTLTPKISGKTDVAFADEKHHQVSTKLDKNENQLSRQKGDSTSREGEVVVRPNQKSKLNQISKKCQQSNNKEGQLYHAQVNLQRTKYQTSMEKGATAISNRTQLKIKPVSKELDKQMAESGKPKSAVPQIYEKLDNLANQRPLPYSGSVGSLDEISKKSEKLAYDDEKSQDLCAEVNSLSSSKKTDRADLDPNKQVLGKSAVEPNQCDVCGKTFKQKSYIKIHMRIHSGEKPFKCKVCGHRYRFVHHLKYHVNNTDCGKPATQLETPDRGKPTCSYCGTYHGGNNANCEKPTDQVVTSDREKPIGGTCSGDVNNTNTDKPTGQPKTSDWKKASHACNRCGKVYDNASLLGIHQRCHNARQATRKSKSNDEKPFKCQFCPKAFKSQAHIDMHERVHTGCRPYKCDLCSLAFKQATHLKSHRSAVHQDKSKARKGRRNLPSKTIPKLKRLEEKYKCEFCVRTFKQQKQLELHKKTHEVGTGLFECEVCGRQFKVWNNLYRHRLVHTGEKPFVCDICGKGCTQKSNLDSHYGRVHKNMARKSDQVVDAGVQTDSTSYKKSDEEANVHGSKENVCTESNAVTNSGKLRSAADQLQTVQIDSNSEERSMDVSSVNQSCSTAKVYNESGVLNDKLQIEAVVGNKDFEVSELHKDSGEKLSIIKKRNLLTELSRLRYKDANSMVENNSNQMSCEGLKNTSKAGGFKESNLFIQSGIQTSNKDSIVKEHHCKSNNEYPFTRIAKSEINNSSGESSVNFEARNTSGNSQCDNSFKNISKEELEHDQLSNEVDENMFVCCECGEAFEQESCMMKHCVDVH